jgi:hypothetical protein
VRYKIKCVVVVVFETQVVINGVLVAVVELVVLVSASKVVVIKVDGHSVHSDGLPTCPMA